MTIMDRRWGSRRDAGSKQSAKLLITPFLLVAVMLLLVDSVASSSRFLHNLSESDIRSSAPATQGHGSFAIHRTMRDLLQDTGFTPPSGSGGDGLSHETPNHEVPLPSP